MDKKEKAVNGLTHTATVIPGSEESDRALWRNYKSKYVTSLEAKAAEERIVWQLLMENISRMQLPGLSCGVAGKERPQRTSLGCS